MRHVPTLAMWEAQEALDAMKLEVFGFRCFKKRTEFHRFSEAYQVSETLDIERASDRVCQFTPHSFLKNSNAPFAATSVHFEANIGFYEAP